ncbi:MAG: hypothetical protein MZV64_33840 [Ignavibacteriales bacterium]|nr:hypothetical protein [Ignavibacteriales bacterium]
MREKAGRPMTYTLAVVDEGLLGPDPLSRRPTCASSFYDREALGVLTWDLFDDVAEAYGAELARLLALGGDEDGDGRGQGQATAAASRRSSCSTGRSSSRPGASGEHKLDDAAVRRRGAGHGRGRRATAPSARPRSRCRCART